MDTLPIPLELLGDTITVSTTNADGTEHSTVVENVRIDRGARSGAHTACNLNIPQDVIFIDAFNSKPFLVPKINDSVLYEGETNPKTIVRVEQLQGFAGAGVHHLEVYVQ